MKSPSPNVSKNFVHGYKRATGLDVNIAITGQISNQYSLSHIMYKYAHLIEYFNIIIAEAINCWASRA